MKKKISVLVMALMTFTMLFTSCKKDDSELILGTWTLNNAKSYIDYTQGDIHEREAAADEDGVVTFSFHSDNTLALIYRYDDGDEGIETVWYTVADGKLTLTMDGEKEVLNIEKLDKKNLILGMTESETIDSVLCTESIHLEFTR